MSCPDCVTVTLECGTNTTAHKIEAALRSYYKGRILAEQYGARVYVVAIDGRSIYDVESFAAGFLTALITYKE
jgi:hypothetical protein